MSSERRPEQAARALENRITRFVIERLYILRLIGIPCFDLSALPFALSQLDGGRLFRADFRLDQPWGL